MFKERKSLEYTLEILRLINGKKDLDSKSIHQLLQEKSDLTPSLSYLQKLLQRLARDTTLINSSKDGYRLAKPLDDIMVNEIFAICDVPPEGDPLHEFCKQVLSALSLTSIDEFYDFGQISDTH